MSTSISALRIEQLKTELRKEEAALSATKTLASELNAACAAEAEAVRLERVNALDIERWTSSLEFLRAECAMRYRGSSEELRAKKNKEFKEAEKTIFSACKLKAAGTRQEAARKSGWCAWRSKKKSPHIRSTRAFAIANATLSNRRPKWSSYCSKARSITGRACWTESRELSAPKTA